MAGDITTFVGRKELLARLLQRFTTSDAIRADVVTGVLGMGKSALLRRTEQQATDTDDVFDALYVDLAAYSTGGRTNEEEISSFGEVLEEYEQFSAFVTIVLARLAPQALGELDVSRADRQKELRKVKTQHFNINTKFIVENSATVISSGQTVNVDASSRGIFDAALSQEIRKWLMEEADILVAALNGRPSERPVLLLLDNADSVLEQKFSRWLGRALNRLRGAVVVLAQDADHAKPLLIGTNAPVPMPPLTESELRELLELRLFRRPIPDDLAPLLHKFSGGVPVAAEVLIDLLNDEGAELEVPELEKRLARLPRDLGSRLDEVVTTMDEHYRGRPLGNALRAASVPERCDVELLSKLLSVEGNPNYDAGELLERLAALSVVTEVAFQGDHYVEVHPFIRRGILERMRKFAPVDRARYHGIVADHYYQQITEAESYGDMFDFETPEKQLALRQWLSHLGESENMDIALMQGARIFLDDMWWWGYYVESDFCEKLATDFEVRAEASANRKFVDFARSVRKFLDHYPFRSRLQQDFEYGYPPAEWDAVQEALLNIRHLCGLMSAPREPSSQQSHVLALTEIFMAHSYRYATDPDRDEATICYSRAEEYFHRVGRWWDLPWVAFESADVALESGDPACARAGVARATEQLYAHFEYENPDEELIANLHRVLADCAWEERDILGAAAEYGRAVLHAYVFHAIGGPPDDYTMQFYFEIRGRAVLRLVSLWASGDETLAVAAAQEMRRAALGRANKPVAEDIVASSLRNRRMADLALALFPRGPDVGELGFDSSPFMTELNRFRHRLGDSIHRDLPGSAES